MRKIILAVLFSLIPIYSFFTWIYIFNKFIDINQADKLLEYNKMFFNISINQTTLSLVNLSLAITSIYFLKKAEVNQNKILKIFAVSSWAACCPFFSRVSEKTGINADATAPSPKTRRCILGILKATKKASAAVEEPNAIAINISLTNPKIRDRSVIPLTAPAALLTLFFIWKEGGGIKISEASLEVV